MAAKGGWRVWHRRMHWNVQSRKTSVPIHCSVMSSRCPLMRWQWQPSCFISAGHRQLWCHDPASRCPLWSPWSHRLAGARWRQRPEDSHGHRSITGSLCRSQRRFPFIATSLRALSKVREFCFWGWICSEFSSLVSVCAVGCVRIFSATLAFACSSAFAQQRWHKAWVYRVRIAKSCNYSTANISVTLPFHPIAKINVPDLLNSKD